MAQVSCLDQNDDRERQKARLMHHAGVTGWSDCELIADPDSGLQFRKRGLLRSLDLLLGRSVSRLGVENKDRLLRFGADLVFRLCHCLGIEVAVVNAPVDRSFEADLARDVLEIITVFAARPYGAKSPVCRSVAQARASRDPPVSAAQERRAVRGLV